MLIPTALVGVVIQMVLERAKQEMELAWRFKENLNLLINALQMMNSILENNSGVETTNGAAQLWLCEVEDIAYDAENMMDVLAFEKVREKVEKIGFFGSLFSSSSTPVLSVREMSLWVQRIDSSIQAAYKKAKTVGLRPADLPPPAAGASAERVVTGDSKVSRDKALRETRDIPDTSFVVGRADDKAKLVDVLCNPCTDDLSVVAIVGLGGLGKTVLAQEVYEEEKVKVHFSERIWIIVSRDFDIKEILIGMMEFIKKSKFDCSSVELGVQALRDHLCGKRYLLVLDDVWNTNQDTWDSLRNALRRISGSECSKILVTTRDRGVAETMHTSEIHHLPELSRVDSWSLFKRTAFSSRISYHDSVLEEIGKRIVNKCRGVPLAIKTIVGVLNAKKGVREWEIVEKSGVQLDKAGILSSLELSYTYLPTPLKKCFSFLSTYRKGSTDWSKHSLIRLWVANGFLHQPLDVNLTMEDIGEEYFSMLIRISFLQECGRNDLGQITRFTIHDLVHDLATYVGKHECLCLDLKAGDIRGHNLEKVKHLSLNGESSAFPDALVLENLRSFISECNLPKGIVLHLKYLRSLQLRDINLEELPVSIAGCKCLKFLDLSGNPIKMLPDWIMSLYSLQTLYLLRCPNLIRIPKGLGKLVNLRHFEVDKFLDLPTGVGHLSSVQTLPRLKVRDRGFQISELRYLQHVSGSLHIGGLELVKSKQDAEMANLSEKSRVERLYLYWTISRREDHSKDLDEEILEGLYPNSNLQVLYIKNYGSKKFPAWVMKKNVSKDIYSESQQLLRNLTKIELVECRRCDELPTMGHLPCLKILKISEMESLKRIGRELYSCGGTIINGASHYPSGSTKPPLVCFPKLEELRLNHLDNLEEWSELEGPMVCFPRLELLVIELCAKLRTSPNKFPSLKNFTANGVNSGLLVSRIIRNNTTQCSSLRTLKIWNCPKLTSLPDLSGLTSLRELSIACNESLRCPPSGLKSCTSLEILEFFKCRKSEAITEDLSGLGRLSQLSISGQTELITQPPDWLLNGLPRLELLDIGSYVELEHYPDISPLLKITSLVRLYLWGWRKLQSQTLPDQLQRFTRLTTLVIDGFDELEQLPEWLGNLSSLEYLSLYRCPKLKRLASMDAMKRLTKLSNLRIWKCRLLEDSVKVGAEHYKVAHIHVRVFKPWETPS